MGIGWFLGRTNAHKELSCMAVRTTGPDKSSPYEGTRGGPSLLTPTRGVTTLLFFDD